MCKLRNVKETNWQTNWFSYHKYIFCRATSNLCKPITWSIKRASQTTNSCTFGRKFLENLFIWNPTTLLPIPPFLFPVHIHTFQFYSITLTKNYLKRHTVTTGNPPKTSLINFTIITFKISGSKFLFLFPIPFFPVFNIKLNLFSSTRWKTHR